MLGQELLPQKAETTSSIEVTTESENFSSYKQPINPYSSVEAAINNIFPQQQDETKVSRLKKILGKSGEQLSDDQIQTLATDFEFLIESWLDSFEKQIFQGMTLEDMLKGR